MEKSIIVWLQNNSNEFLDLFFSGYSYIVSWIGAVFLFACIIIFVNKKFGLFFGTSFLITIALNYLLKIIVNRPRPYETNPDIVNKLSTIGKSFPSGHAVSITFMILSVLYILYLQSKKENFILLKKKWFKVFSIFIAVLLVFVTAIARMYLGQHYLTDIIAGISLSGACFSVSLLILTKAKKQ